MTVYTGFSSANDPLENWWSWLANESDECWSVCDITDNNDSSNVDVEIKIFLMRYMKERIINDANNWNKNNKTNGKKSKNIEIRNDSNFN